MRFLLFSLLLLPALASADRVITVPSGYVLRPGEFRIEQVLGLGEAPLSIVQVGLPYFMEVQIARNPSDVSVDLFYSIIQPFADYFPGLSLGVLDLLSDTDRGRTYFAAFTFQQFIESDWAWDEMAQLTIGLGSQPGFRGAFLGIVLPMHRRVTLIGEHDSRVMTVGLQIEPVPHVALRAMVRENKPLIGVQVFRKF